MARFHTAIAIALAFVIAMGQFPHSDSDPLLNI